MDWQDLDVSTTDISAYVVHLDGRGWVLLNEEGEEIPYSFLGRDIGPDKEIQALVRASFWLNGYGLGLVRGKENGREYAQAEIRAALGISS